MKDLPTVFHITHWKAGSQWVREVLKEAVPDRYRHVAGDFPMLGPDRIELGAVYTPVYLPVHAFQRYVQPSAWGPQFVVIRDLRDTLVSWYFSIKYSHGTTTANVSETVVPYRARFMEASVEEGLLIALRERLEPMSMIQASWLQTDALVLRYEEMIEDEQLAFERIFDHCGFAVDAAKRHEIVERHSFERRSGRKRGEENVSAHHRKGVAGDWRNHFTPRVTSEFKERFGPLLIQAGHERSMEW